MTFFDTEPELLQKNVSLSAVVNSKGMDRPKSRRTTAIQGQPRPDLLYDSSRVPGINGMGPVDLVIRELTKSTGPMRV